MAINPPSDIVLGVAAAADPAKLRAAADRLTSLGGAELTGRFETLVVELAAAQDRASATAKTLPAPAAMAAPTAAAPLPEARKDPNLEAMRKLEGFFLQSFVEAALPKNAETVYGAGLAGDVWKSMLAEQIAAEIARSTKFGIADRLAGQHFTQTAANAPGSISAASARSETVGANLPYVAPHPQPEAAHAALLGPNSPGKRKG